MIWLTSRIGRLLTGALALLALFVGYGAVREREGAQEAEKEALEDRQKRNEGGRDAVAKEQAETTGLSDSDVIDRMRRRDRDRRGL